MADVRVEFIGISGGETHEHITHLGNSAGKWTVADVVAWIEAGTTTFFVDAGGRRADVRVRQLGQ
jgi:hypothetical protein